MPKAAKPSPLNLCAFRSAGVTESGDVPPVRLVIAPLGRHDARSRGPVVISAETLDGLAARQNAAKLGMRLALDAEHATVEGTPAYAASSEPRPVLAWGTLTAEVGIGLVLTDLEWTPLGLEAWKNKAYQDISPAVFRRADGTVLAVHSAALCRHGELDGLTISAASAGGRLAPFFAALSSSVEIEITSMKPSPALIALLSALGVTLSAEADEAAVDAALISAAEAVDKAKKPEPMSAASGELTALKARLDAFEAADQQRQRDALVATATAEGKVIPLSAEDIAKTPLDVLGNLITGLKAGVVPLSSDGTKKAKETTQTEYAPESLEVFSRFGLKPEDIK